MMEQTGAKLLIIKKIKPRLIIGALIVLFIKIADSTAFPFTYHKTVRFLCAYYPHSIKL
jgi:hypothetical protein